MAYYNVDEFSVPNTGISLSLDNIRDVHVEWIEDALSEVELERREELGLDAQNALEEAVELLLKKISGTISIEETNVRFKTLSLRIRANKGDVRHISDELFSHMLNVYTGVAGSYGVWYFTGHWRNLVNSMQALGMIAMETTLSGSPGKLYGMMMALGEIRKYIPQGLSYLEYINFLLYAKKPDLSVSDDSFVTQFVESLKDKPITRNLLNIYEFLKGTPSETSYTKALQNLSNLALSSGDREEVLSPDNPSDSSRGITSALSSLTSWVGETVKEAGSRIFHGSPLDERVNRLRHKIGQEIESQKFKAHQTAENVMFEVNSAYRSRDHIMYGMNAVIAIIVMIMIYVLLKYCYNVYNSSRRKEREETGNQLREIVGELRHQVYSVDFSGAEKLDSAERFGLYRSLKALERVRVGPSRNTLLLEEKKEADEERRSRYHAP